MVKKEEYGRGHPYKGFFLHFDGPDGCGKSTQLRSIIVDLSKLGYIVRTFREPGGTDIGERIREILLSTKSEGMSLETEMLLYQASRAQNVFQNIIPALEKGEIVIVDRFDSSTYAYQGAGGKMDYSKIASVGNIAIQGVSPDLSLIFDLPVDVAMQRIMAGRGISSLDRIEQRDRDYFQRVREGYLDLTEKDPIRFKKVDATRPIEEVYIPVKEEVIRYIKRYNLEKTLARQNP